MESDKINSIIEEMLDYNNQNGWYWNLMPDSDDLDWDVLKDFCRAFAERIKE